MDLDVSQLPLADARLDECAACNARYLLQEVITEEDGIEDE